MARKKSGDIMKVLSKENFKVLAKRNNWTVAQAQGYVDGQISRERGKVPPNYALVGRDEYCLGFRAGYFASDRKLPRVPRDVK
jgi:hypothetical protein